MLFILNCKLGGKGLLGTKLALTMVTYSVCHLLKWQKILRNAYVIMIRTYEIIHLILNIKGWFSLVHKQNI